MPVQRINREAYASAEELFKSERTSWEIKTIVDKNGKQRKVRVAPDKVEVKSILQKKKETKELQDSDIINDAVSKDKAVSQKAKSQLYEKYHDDAYRIIYTFLQTHEEIPDVKELSEDLTTDSFIKIYENLENYAETLQPALPFKHWFNRTVSNTARDYLRSLDLKIKQNALSAEEMKSHLNSASDTHTPYEDLVAEEKVRAIHSAIDSLPEEYSKPIKLFYFEEKSFAEIGNEMGISESAVSSRIQYARKMLKNKLTPELFKALTLYFDSKDILNK